MNQKLIDFYRGNDSDNRRRYIDDIWNWDHEKLEDVHDYIQWLFPSSRPSEYNPDAPLLDEETIAVFREDADLQVRLSKSVDLMLDFYGLELLLSCGFMVRQAHNYEQRRANWQEPSRSALNHNLLRLTRIIDALRVLGQANQSMALFYCLAEIAAGIPDKIPPSTVEYWRKAADGE